MALVAVFDRVHGGLGDRGLEPFEPPARKVDITNACRDALHCLALVAADARDLELVEDPHLRSTCGPDQRDQGDVVLLFPRRPSEAFEILEQLVDERLPGLEATDELPHPRKAEHFPFRIVRLGQTIAVQQQPLAGVEDGLLLLVSHVSH